MKLCKQTMINSYNNISFSPERRGEQDFNHYTELLKDDLLVLGDSQGNYERKFIQKVMMIYHRQARCASAMIVGPARFPTRSNQKKVESHRRSEDEFTHWRKRYLNLATRERTLTPEQEIDKCLASIDELTLERDAYKAANKLTTREERISYLENEGHYHKRAISLLEYGDGKIPLFAINSLTTKIRERDKKLELMKQRIETKSEFQRKNFKGGYLDIENDRVVIKHHEKPSREILDIIKKAGFRYSPKTQSWVRKHTENALYSAQKIIPSIEVQDV